MAKDVKIYTTPKKASVLKKDLKMNINIGFNNFVVSVLDKALLAKNLAVMLRAGLNLFESLEIARSQSKGKLKKVMGEIVKSVGEGKTFAESLAQYPRIFQNIFVNLVKIGEASGTLDSNLEHLADSLEKDLSLRRKVKSAMLYPVFVITAAFFLGLGMAIFVLPKITGIFKSFNIELPLTTRILIKISDIAQAYGIYIGIGSVIGVIFIFWLLRQKFMHPITHKIILSLPVIKGLSINVNLARYCRTMATLLESGLTIDNGLEIAKNAMDNYYYQQELKKVIDWVEKGETMSYGLLKNETLFPPIVSRMVSVGEKSGNLDNVLTYLAGYYEAEVDNQTKNLATILEPIMLLVIGFVVAALALSILTPIYQITGSMQG